MKSNKRSSAIRKLQRQLREETEERHWLMEQILSDADTIPIGDGKVMFDGRWAMALSSIQFQIDDCLEELKAIREQLLKDDPHGHLPIIKSLIEETEKDVTFIRSKEDERDTEFLKDMNIST